MSGLVNGIYQAAAELQKLVMPGTALAIMVAAVTALINSENWKVVIKERITMILVVMALAFSATEIVKTFSSWFM